MLTRLRRQIQRVETSTTPTDDLVVSFESAVRHLRAIGVDDGKTILESLQAAVDESERESRRTLRKSVTRTVYYYAFEYVLNCPFPPLQSITSVKYYDPDDTLQTVSASDYNVLASTDSTGRINFDASFSFPNVNTDRIDPIQVIMVTGYGTDAFIPSIAKTAVRLFCAANYDTDPKARELAEKVIRKIRYRGSS